MSSCDPGRVDVLLAPYDDAEDFARDIAFHEADEAAALNDWDEGAMPTDNFRLFAAVCAPCSMT